MNVQLGKVRTEPLSDGQVGISDETYDQIVFDQLTELWTEYGSLTEVRNLLMDSLLHILTVSDRSGSMVVTPARKAVKFRVSWSNTSLKPSYSEAAKTMALVFLRTLVRVCSLDM